VDGLNDLALLEQGDGVSFEVRVAPRASRSAIAGVHAGALKLSLTAAPVDGAANDALIALLADVLGVPKRTLTIARGERGRSKTVRVAGISAAALRAALLDALGGTS
jgi:uncharacterized protein (TIGR00251 family)